MILAKTGLIKILAVLFAIITGSTLGLICYFALNLGGFTRPPLEVVHDVSTPSIGIVAVLFLAALIAWISKDARKVKTSMESEEVESLLGQWRSIESDFTSVDMDLFMAIRQHKESAKYRMSNARTLSELAREFDNFCKDLGKVTEIQEEAGRLSNIYTEIADKLSSKGYEVPCNSYILTFTEDIRSAFFDMQDYAESCKMHLKGRSLEDIGEFCRQQMAKSRDTV